MLDIIIRGEKICVGDEHDVLPKGDKWVVYYSCNWPLPDLEFKASFEDKDDAIQYAYEQELLGMQLGDFTMNDHFTLCALAYANARAAICAHRSEALKNAKVVPENKQSGGA